MRFGLIAALALLAVSASAQERPPYVAWEMDEKTYNALMASLQRGVDFERAFPIWQLLVNREQNAMMTARSKAAQDGAAEAATHPAGPDAPPGLVVPPIPSSAAPVPGALLERMKGKP